MHDMSGDTALGHFFDVAVRDLELAVAAFVLAKLTEIRKSAAVEARSGAQWNHVFEATSTCHFA